MRSILLFAEDSGHEKIVSALVQRLAAEHEVNISLRVRSATGGHGKVFDALRMFLRDLPRQQEPLPDLLLVALDANCKGYVACRREVETALASYPLPFACAIPDPHVERWLLLDGAAFREVLGKGCSAPDQKCDRDRYKNLLSSAVRATGVTPLLGGIEHGEELINAMDLARASADSSLGRFLSELQAQFHQWKSVDMTGQAINVTGGQEMR